MKKFMKKLPVMITLLALTVVWLGVYLFMQLRPVAYGMSYKHKEYDAEDKITTETYYTLKCNNKAVTNVIYYDDLGTYKRENTGTMWFVKQGKFIFLGQIAEKTNADRMQFKTFDEFKKFVEDKKILDEKTAEDTYNSKVYYAYMLRITGTAFTAQICHQEEDQVIHNCTNYETITFSVVGGIVILVLLAGSVWSVLLFVKDRKNKPAPVAETKAE